MAPSAKQFSLFLLFTLLFSSLHHSTQARDSQFFNKAQPTTTTPATTTTTIPQTTTTEQLPNNQQQQQNQQEQEPDFVVPDREDSYGLYSHETGQLPPSTTTSQQPINKHLPKNYNPVAYVTQPEDNTDNTPSFTEQKSFSTNPTNYYNAATTNRNYYDTQLEQDQEPEDEEQEQEQQVPQEYRNYPSTTTPFYSNNRYTNNYNMGSSFNSPRRTNTNTNHNNNNNGFRPQPQGMSDTRFLENGKYFYDVNNEKFNANHPYETLKTANRYNGNRNYYSNRGNGYEFQNQNYQDEDQFQNEEINYNMP